MMKHMSFIGIVIVTALCLLPFGGGGNGLIAQPSYKSITVKNGGTIRGTVLLSGETKKIPEMEIPKDAEICGVRTPSPRLVVGPAKGVQYAVISLEGITEGKTHSRSKTRIVIDQRKCQYEPHVTILPIGEEPEIVNSDRILHNVHAYDLNGSQTTLFNIAQPIKGQRTPIKASMFKKPGLVLLTCDAGHPWMSAYIVVAEHPYYAVTDRTGSFVLDNIPPGSYTLRMWHEGVAVTKTDLERGKPVRYYFEAPYEERTGVIVEPGKTIEVNFDLTLR